jgi:hypothetical protein
MSELCCCYGWSLEYVLTLSFYQINYFYKYGRRFILQVNHFQIKESKTEVRESFEELKSLYYTPEEIAEQEAYKRSVMA